MTRPRPDAPVPHAFAAEYQRATGCVVEVTWRDAARQWVPAGPGSYVEFLEYELKMARRKLIEVEAKCVSSNGPLPKADAGGSPRTEPQIAGKE